MLICLTTEWFTSLPQSVLNERRLREDVDFWLFTCAVSCGWNCELCLQVMVGGSAPEPVQ